MDAIDRRIIGFLAVEGRVSLKALAAAVGLSPPSTSERMRRLEESGAIVGYTIQVDPIALGFNLQAIVRIRPLPGRSEQVGELIAAIPEVCECDKVTGDDCYVARVFVQSIQQLDDILRHVSEHAATSTSIVKSQLIRRRPPPLGLAPRI